MRIFSTLILLTRRYKSSDCVHRWLLNYPHLASSSSVNKNQINSCQVLSCCLINVFKYFFYSHHRLQMNDEVRSADLGADPGTETAENTADDEHEALADVGEVG